MAFSSIDSNISFFLVYIFPALGVVLVPSYVSLKFLEVKNFVLGCCRCF